MDHVLELGILRREGKENPKYSKSFLQACDMLILFVVEKKRKEIGGMVVRVGS